jgi:hypothetical protein
MKGRGKKSTRRGRRAKMTLASRYECRGRCCRNLVYLSY